MQMRKWLYEPKSVKARAEYYRIQARELETAGYPGSAEVAWQMAEWLDPTPREAKVYHNDTRRQVNRLNGPTRAPKPNKGADPSRVGGRRDGLPVSSNRNPARIVAARPSGVLRA